MGALCSGQYWRDGGLRRDARLHPFSGGRACRAGRSMSEAVETEIIVRSGTFQLAGAAEGEALVFSQSLSFWGGIDAETGDIIDHSHPGLGKNVAGKILI